MNIDLPNYVIKIESRMIKQVTRDNKETVIGVDKFKYKFSITPRVNSFKNSYSIEPSFSGTYFHLR